MSRDILLTQVRPNRSQPRTQFDEEKVRELAMSIDVHGVLSPIMVRPCGDGYEIIHGERRFRAVQSLGWDAIPASVVEMDDEQSAWAALVENIQRENLSPLEEAEAYRAMVDAGFTQGQIAEKVGKSQSYVATKLRLLAMPEPLKPWLRVLTEGHMKQVLRLRKFYAGIPDRKIDGDGYLFIDDERADTERLIECAEDGKDDELRARIALSYNMFRPWDAPLLFVPKGTNLQCAVDSLMGLAEEAKDGSVPAWEVPAVWFAAFAACCKFSVVDTRDVIDLFIDMVSSHVAWVGNDRADTDRPVKWWAMKSDLRHAGLSGPLPDDFVWEACNHVLKRNIYVPPSTMHPWAASNKL